MVFVEKLMVAQLVNTFPVFSTLKPVEREIERQRESERGVVRERDTIFYGAEGGRIIFLP
jgi:hypothetical protein